MKRSHAQVAAADRLRARMGRRPSGLDADAPRARSRPPQRDLERIAARSPRTLARLQRPRPRPAPDAGPALGARPTPPRASARLHHAAPSLHARRRLAGPRVEAADAPLDGRSARKVPVDPSVLGSQQRRASSRRRGPAGAQLIRFSSRSSRSEARRSAPRGASRAPERGGALGFLDPRTRAWARIGPASISSDIFMTVTPVSVSPFAIAHWTGAAPRYFGRREDGC